MPAGVQGRGPGGMTVTRSATVGKPLTIRAVVKDDGKSAGLVRGGVPVALAWFTHQGPSQVTFGTPTVQLTPTGGKASTTATFSKPGSYRYVCSIHPQMVGTIVVTAP